ncbi:MAG: hypothetical protein GYB31_14385 [Bacteroidetes bacterium]|nr:hypothetical protein [Bacteroidota bacterium]
MNKDILDENLDAPRLDLERERRNRKALLYLTIMVLGCITTAVLKYHSLAMITFQSVVLFIIPALVALVSESIRYLLRMSKGNKHKAPFWFHLIEGALSIWILMTLWMIVDDLFL